MPRGKAAAHRPRVIVAAAPKGGVGKTTLSMSILVSATAGWIVGSWRQHGMNSRAGAVVYASQ